MPSKGFAELNAKYDKIEAKYLKTTHPKRVQQLFDSRELDIDRIVIMGIGDNNNELWQLAMILA